MCRFAAAYTVEYIVTYVRAWKKIFIARRTYVQNGGQSVDRRKIPLQ
jgi:hypothetical protein